MGDEAVAHSALTGNPGRVYGEGGFALAEILDGYSMDCENDGHSSFRSSTRAALASFRECAGWLVRKRRGRVFDAGA